MTYVVSTPTFSGPIELLLSLVSSHEVDILEVELAPVVDAFVRASTRSGGLVINIGTGEELSVNDLYATMAEAAGSGARAPRLLRGQGL